MEKKPSIRYFEYVKQNFWPYKNDVSVVSDVHLSFPDQDILQDIRNIAYGNSKRVIFLGDLVGSSLEEIARDKFYDGVISQAKDFLEIEDSREISNIKLGEHFRQSYLDLVRWEKGVTGEDFDQNISNFKIGEDLKDLVKIGIVGSYLSKRFPKKVTEKITAERKVNMGVFVEMARFLQGTGKDIRIIQGNCDTRGPVLARDCLENEGFKMVEDLEYFEGKDSVYCMIGYDEVNNIGKNIQIKGKIEEIKNIGKNIVLFTHGELSWEPYKLFNDSKTNDHERVTKNMELLVNMLEPRVVVTGHVHKNVIDEAGSWDTLRYFWQTKSGKEVTVYGLSQRQIL